MRWDHLFCDEQVAENYAKIMQWFGKYFVQYKNIRANITPKLFLEKYLDIRVFDRYSSIR